jgi:hypothetical protein
MTPKWTTLWQAVGQHLIGKRHEDALPSIGKLQTTYRKDSSLPAIRTSSCVVVETLVVMRAWTRAGALVFPLLC